MRSRHGRKVMVVAAAIAVAAIAYYWWSRPRDLETITDDYYARSTKLAAELEYVELVAKLEYADLERARKILQQLAIYGSLAKPAVPTIVSLCEHDYQPVRYAAYRALGRIGDERGLEPLLDVLSNEQRGHRGALYRLCDALATFHDPEMLIPLLQMCADGVESLVEGMAAIASIRLVNNHPDALVEALRHDDSDIRRWAVNFSQTMMRWLYLWPETRDYITTELTTLAADESDPIHDDLIKLLKQIEVSNSVNWEDDSVDKEVPNRFKFQGWTIERLVRAKGDDAVSVLLEALDAVPDGQLFRAVIEALAYLRAEEAVYPLINLLESNDTRLGSSDDDHYQILDYTQRERVVHALRDITGENFGEITEAWRAWYREQH